MKTNRWIGWLLALSMLFAPARVWCAPAAQPPDVLKDLLAQIQDKNKTWEERAKAWENAGRLGPSAIPKLAKIMAGEDKDMAKIAATVMEFVVHRADRPGAQAERKLANAELVKLIAPAQPENVRILALRLLASSADDETVPAIAAVMRDPDPKMRERARWALERIPTKGAVKALLAALPSAPAEFRRDIILTLGKKKAPEAVAPLIREARSNDPRIRLAAIEALARIGDSRAREAIEPSISAFSGHQRRLALDDYLRLGDSLAQRGEKSAAFSIYKAVLQGSKLDAARCAALVGLSKVGGSESLSLILDSLNDRSAKVRNAAAQTLIGMKAVGTNTRLVQVARTAKPALKVMLLRILAARKAPQANELLKAASRDPNPEIRVTALDLLGGLNDPSLEPLLLEAAEKGSDQVRPIALRSYLKIADARLRAGYKAKALQMYHRALDLASADDVRLQALDGIAAIASPESLARVEKLITPASGVRVRDAASRAYIAILAEMGKAGKKETAIRKLSDLVAQTRSPSVATYAITELRKLGADTSGFAAKAGFVTRWWVIGPFPFNKTTAPFDKAFISPDSVDPQKPVELDGKTLKWKQVRTDNPQGRVDLEHRFRPNNNVAAYAYAEIEVPRARDVHLLIGSDDGFICWVNGKQIGANNVTRPLRVDQDVLKAHLVKGTNRLLLKITQGGGQWEFCVRIANTQNRPIDLTRWGETVR